LQQQPRVRARVLRQARWEQVSPICNGIKEIVRS
jgi:hypothetical protein